MSSHNLLQNTFRKANVKLLKTISSYLAIQNLHLNSSVKAYFYCTTTKDFLQDTVNFWVQLCFNFSPDFWVGLGFTLFFFTGCKILHGFNLLVLRSRISCIENKAIFIVCHFIFDFLFSFSRNPSTVNGH